MQFHATCTSADELEAYLKGQEVQAKEAEFLALARADDGEMQQTGTLGGKGLHLGQRHNPREPALFPGHKPKIATSRK